MPEERPLPEIAQEIIARALEDASDARELTRRQGYAGKEKRTQEINAMTDALIESVTLAAKSDILDKEKVASKLRELLLILDPNGEQRLS